jgi:hypothetical protein
MSKITDNGEGKKSNNFTHWDWTVDRQSIVSKLPSTEKREQSSGLTGIIKMFVERKMQDKFFVVQSVWMKLSGSRQVTTLHHHAFTVSMSHSEYNKSCYLQPIQDQRINTQNSTCKAQLSVLANLMDSPKH